MATYYWVGGNGTWNNVSTTNWATSTGGAGGFGPPLAADTVIFDSASGTGTCTTATGSTCTTATLNSSTLGLTLGANHTISGAFTLTLGALNLANFTLTSLTFVSSGAGTRSIAFGTGTITLTGNAATVWNTSVAGGFTYTGTPKVICNYSGGTGTRTIAAGTSSGGTDTNTPSFYIIAGTDIVSITHALTIDLTGFAGTFSNIARNLYGDLVIPSGVTVTAGTLQTIFRSSATTQNINVNSAITLDFPIRLGVSGTPTYKLLNNLTVGSTRTIQLYIGTLDLNGQTLTTGLFDANLATTRAILFGVGNITSNGSGIVWQNAVANFSYTGTPTINISNNSATATTVITGAMTAAQALNFNYTTGTYTLTDTAAVYKTVNFTGFAGTIPNSVRTIYGSVIFSAGMTLTAGANATTFAAISGTNNITTAAKTLDFPIIFNGIGGTWVFQDALTQGSTRAFTITNGTVQLKASATSTVGAFATSGTNQKYLQSTTPGTQATLTQASGTVDATYLSIKDIVATGNATWNALWSSNNVDEGNNSGWVFGDPPIISAVEYTYALRSFTQPRRF